MEALMMNLNLLHPIPIGATTRLRPNPTGLKHTLPMKSKHHRMTPIRMSFSETGPAVAVVAGECADGADFLTLIEERDFPYRSLKILGHELDDGVRLKFEGKMYTIEVLESRKQFADVDIAMFCGGPSWTEAFGQPLCAQKEDVIVVGTVEAFKMVETIVGRVNWDK